MKICGIYKITNLINWKMLIGQSINIYKRWACYRSQLKKGVYENPHLQRAWNQYGEGNFKFEIIFLCSPQDLNNEEVRFIELYKSNDSKIGYNLQSGGKNFVRFSEEVKKRMSRAQKGKRLSLEHKLAISQTLMGHRQSEETKQKLSDLQKGKLHPNYGKHLSKETRQKIKIANMGNQNCLGRKLSRETRKKISNAHMGKTFSKESRIKMSKAKKEMWTKRRLGLQ